VNRGRHIAVHQPDTAAAFARQIAHRLLRRVAIVDSDGRGRYSGIVFRALHPGRVADKSGDILQRRRRIHSDDAIHHFAGQQAEIGGFSPQLRGGVAEQNMVALRLCFRFDALHHARAERIRDIRDQHQQHMALGGAQLARQQIRLIVAGGDRRQHPIARICFHPWMIVKHAGYRCF